MKNSSYKKFVEPKEELSSKNCCSNVFDLLSSKCHTNVSQIGKAIIRKKIETSMYVKQLCMRPAALFGSLLLLDDGFL